MKKKIDNCEIQAQTLQAMMKSVIAEAIHILHNELNSGKDIYTDRMRDE